MLNLITMTPWEHRDKYTQYTDTGYEIDDDIDEIFDNYIACDVEDWDDGRPLIGELATKPIYSEYIAQYRGSDCDNSPIKFGEKGYTYECDSYVSSIHTLRPRIKAGLCILCAASYGFNVYTNKYNLDKITIEFLAKREEEYTVYLNLFSNFSDYWHDVDESLYNRITIDGVTLTKENYFNLIINHDRITQIYPEYVAQSKKEYDSHKPSRHDPYRFDAALTLPASDFIMDIERTMLIRKNKAFPTIPYDENKLEEEVRSGKCTELFLGYEVIIHTQSILNEFITEYPVIFAVREFEDGSMECGKFSLKYGPEFLGMLENMYNDANERGYSRAIYAAFNKPCFDNIKQYELDLFKEVEMYVEIDAKNKQLHLYDSGYFGRKKFFDFYKEDAKFISGDN